MVWFCVNLLLDTHVLLWWLSDSAKLSNKFRELIYDTDHRVFVSSISITEISIKASLGKLEAPPGMSDYAVQSGFELLTFEATHAEVLRELPWHHRDPFDRMLIAQATVEGLLFLSEDAHISRYDGILLA